MLNHFFQTFLPSATRKCYKYGLSLPSVHTNLVLLLQALHQSPYPSRLWIRIFYKSCARVHSLYRELVPTVPVIPPWVLVQFHQAGKVLFNPQQRTSGDPYEKATVQSRFLFPF